MIKSNQELTYMRNAGKIANLAMKKAMEKVDVGIRQCDVIAELNKITTSGTKEIGGTFTCKPPNAMVGKFCSAPHLSWTEKKLKKNEIFYIEMGGAKHRYHVPLARCIFTGKTPKKIVSWPFYSGGKKRSTINKNSNLTNRKRLLLNME